MRSKIVLFLFAGLTALVLCSNSGGYGANRTGVKGGTIGCGGGCHGSTSANTVTVGLDSAGIPVTSYYPGVTYRVKIKAINGTGLNLPYFGFQVSVARLSGAGTASATQGGTWGAMQTGVQNSGGTPVLIEHSQRLSPISGTGGNGTIYTDSMLWTAPASGTGSVKIYGVVNAVNFNPSSDDNGDKWQAAVPVTISEAAASLVAGVHIAITSGSNPTCAGSSVTFTSTPTNGGTTPSYQWKVNGNNVGSNSATYSSATLSNLDIVTCVMTSNLVGVTGNPATSNSIMMTVNATVTPSDSITATGGTTICAGTSVTFTAHPVNGGNVPSYQWKVNGNNAGVNSPTYTTTTLTNNAIVTCVMTSTASCASPSTVTSNPLTMTVMPTVVPADTISTPTTSVCAGAGVTFTVSPTNGGSAPSYQWKVNGNNVGTNSTTYTTTTLTNNAIVTCVMTSNATCAAPVTATSNSITMSVNNLSAPTIIIHNNSTQCIGTPDTFSAVIANGGPSPSFQWQVNGSSSGTNSSSFISSVLSAGDVISCVLTSSSACASPVTATSNSVTVAFAAPVAPAVHIGTATDTICQGSSVTFIAIPVNGGPAPVYQWKLNANNVGNNGNTYSSSVLADGDVISCVLTSNAVCVSPATAVSDSLTMTVHPTVSPAINISTSDSVICQGATAAFTAISINGGPTPVYQWRINGNITGINSTSFSSSALTNGQLVTCTLASSAVCAAPTQITSSGIVMTVKAAPAATLTPHGSVVICNGDSQLVTAGGGASYTWSTGSQSSSIHVNQGGTYTVTVTGANSCTATAPSLNITVHTPSVPVITQSGNTLTAPAGTHYQWMLSGNVLPGDTISTLHISQTGSYTVMVTDASGCAATSVAQTYVYTTGINTIGSDLGLQVYPVPNHGSFIVQVVHVQYAEVSIHNMYGQMMYRQAMTGDRLEVDAPGLDAGIYIVTVSDAGMSQTIKMQIIKE